MDWSAWAFSAKLAWRHPWVRWLSVATALMFFGATGFYLWRIIPAAQQNGAAVMHYNIYLGIDDVRVWPWVFAWPLLWLTVTVTDLLWAYGQYREDPLVSYALVALAFFWGFPWASALFYLSLINV